MSRRYGNGEAPLFIWSSILGELTPSVERRSLSLAFELAVAPCTDRSSRNGAGIFIWPLVIFRDPRTIVRYLPAVSSYHLLVLLSPPLRATTWHCAEVDVDAIITVSSASGAAAVRFPQPRVHRQ